MGVWLLMQPEAGIVPGNGGVTGGRRCKERTD
jgi:hypothetical protein